MLDDNREAISSLKRIAAKSKNEIKRLGVLVNAYEQQGYCLIEMIENGDSKEPLSDKKEVTHLFFKAIELQAGILRKAPELKGAQSPFRTVDKKDALAHLNQLLDRHSKRIRLYEEEDVATSNSGRDYCSKARSHMAQDQYYAAIYDLFKATQFTEEVNTMEEDLYSQVYFEGAVQAYKNKEIALAHTRFKEIYTKMQTSESDVEGEQRDQNEYYYIQFIHLCAMHCNYAHRVSKLLQMYTGINHLINTDSCMIGKMKPKNIREVMRSVRKIVILMHKDDGCPQKDYHIDLAVGVEHEQGQNKIAVMSEPGTELPPVLNIPSIPHITCPVELDIMDTMTSEHEQFLKDVFAQVITLS